MRKHLILLVIIFITGCSTKPISTDKAENVPGNRIWDKTITKKTDDSGTIIIKRDSGLLGSPCATSIYLDGNPIADINTREKITIYPNPGRYVLSAKPNGWCAGGIIEINADVDAHKPLIYRIGYGDNGEFRLSPTAF